MLLFISLIFLYYTYKNFSINDLKDALNIVNLTNVLIYLILFFPIIYIASIKYILLVDKFKKIKLSTSIKVNLISSFYNLFFPAKLGDLTRYYYSKIPKKYFVNCLSLFFFEKLISFLSLILIVLFCSEVDNHQNLIFLSILFFFLILIFLNNFNKINNILNLIIQKLYQFKFKTHKKIKEKLNFQFFFFFILDTIVWLIIFLQIYTISSQINVKIDFLIVCFIFGYSILAGLVPISFGGFGVRDIIIYNSLESYLNNNEILILLLFFNLRYFIPAIFGFIFNTLKLYDKKKFFKKN